MTQGKTQFNLDENLEEKEIIKTSIGILANTLDFGIMENLNKMDKN